MLDHLQEFVEQARPGGVQLFGAIQRDERDAAALLEDEFAVFQVTVSSAISLRYGGSIAAAPASGWQLMPPGAGAG